MQLTESHKRTAEQELESERPEKLARVTFDAEATLEDGIASTRKSPATPWTYADEHESADESEDEETPRKSVTFDASEAEPLEWTSRRSLTPMPPATFGNADAEDEYECDLEDLPPRMSLEQHSGHLDTPNGECLTNLPTLQYTGDGFQSPEHPHTLFSPEPATEVAATEHPTAWDSHDAETAADAETRLSQEADFAYLASTLAAWSPASPLPEDPKTFQNPKTLQEADDAAPDTVLLEGCDTLA